MGIWLGILSAFSFGTADYFAGRSSRRIGVFSSLFFIQFIGLILLTGTMAALQQWHHLLSIQHIASASLWMALDLIGILMLYQGLHVGHASVVAPIASSFSAVTVILAVIYGEGLNGLIAAGILITILGVILTTIIIRRNPDRLRTPSNPSNPTPRLASGALWAVLAALALGAAFFGLRYPSEAIGGVTVVWIGRLQTCLGLILFMLLFRKSLVTPGIRHMSLLLVPGTLDGLALVSYNIGLTLEDTSIVVTATSLFAVVTVLWGVLVGRERLAWNQWLGVSMTFVGMIVISLR